MLSRVKKRKKKKTKNRMRGGSRIQNSKNSGEYWLVCDNPYCWENHDESSKIFTYKTDISGLEETHYIIQFRLISTGDTFYISYKKDPLDTPPVSFFYIGNSIETKYPNISENKKYSLVYKNFENLSDEYQESLDKPKLNLEISNNILMSLIQLIENIPNSSKCDPEKEIKEILHYINSRGREISKIRPNSNYEWIGTNNNSSGKLETINDKDFLNVIFNTKISSNEKDSESFVDLNSLNKRIELKESLKEIIKDFNNLYVKYGYENIYDNLNDNLKIYYHNRGRILKVIDEGSKLIIDQKILTVDQIDTNIGDKAGFILYKTPKDMIINTEKINNEYIIYKFKQIYIKIFFRILKYNCYFISNTESSIELKSLKYTEDESQGNINHKNFDLSKAIGEEITEIDLSDSHTTISDELIKKIFEKIFEKDLAIYKGEDKPEPDTNDILTEYKKNYYQLKEIINPIDINNEKLINIALLLPFIKDIDDITQKKAYINGIDSKIDTLDFLLNNILNNDGNYMFYYYLENFIYKKNSMENGLCFCNYCSKKKIN